MAAAGEPDPGARAGFEFGAEDWVAFREQISSGGHDQQCLDLCPICRAADILRAAGTPELRHGIGGLQREALLTARAMIDHYLERVETEPDPAGRVEQIPID